MSCRRVDEACMALLSSCRPHTISCLARRPRGKRLLSSASAARPQRPRRRSTRGAHPSDARRTIYTEQGGKLRLETPARRRDLSSSDEPAENLPSAPSVAVLGGGVAGLTAAHYLAEDLPPRSKIVLYEGDTRVGGWLRSEKVPVDVGSVKSEVLFERGPRMMSMRSMNGTFDRLVMFDLVRKTALPGTSGHGDLPRFIYHNDELTPVPPLKDLYEYLQNPLMLEIGPSALFHYFKNIKFRLGFNPPKEDMSIAEWADRVFQTPKMRVPLSAMMHGIWGGDIDKLSALSVLGPLFRRIHISGTGLTDSRELRFLHTFLSEERDKDDLSLLDGGRQMFFGKHGMESLPQALADTLESASNVEMRMGQPVKELTYNETQEQVLVRDSENEVESYDKVISTLPAHQLAKITGDKLPQLASFQSTTIMTVNIWYPYEGIVPKGLGYLIPSSVPYEQNPERALGVFFDSYVGIGSDQNYKEPGTKLFVLMGGHYYDGIQPPSEGQAVDQAKTLLERHLGVPRETPCHASASLARECLPQHCVGHHANITKLSEQLRYGFGNRLAAVGGSFSRPGVVPAARAGWDISNDVANLDFLSNGLEDFVEEKFLHPTFLSFDKHTLTLVKTGQN